MNENNSIEAIDKTEFRLSKIIGIEVIFTKRLIKEKHALKN